MDWKETAADIGVHKSGDYRLAPLAHAALYVQLSPELSNLLRSGPPAATALAYERADKAAIEAQASYKKWMTSASIAIFITAVLSAASMAAAIWWPLALPQEFWWGRALAACAAVSAAFGMFSLYKLREGELLEGWMSARATAETHRLGYFSAIASFASKKNQSDCLMLVLEYFRRYQLDLEMNFYSIRAAEHKKSANFTVTLGAIGAALAAISGTVSATAPSAILGSLSVLGAATGAFAVSREQMNQDRRNAERYGRTWDALNGLYGRLDEVRTAAAQGNGDAVTEFVAAVNDQISLEHRQWLEASESNKAAMARLEAALAPRKASESKAGRGGPK
jgi:SMODS and SLOG-associating 2TM effector domain 1